MPMIEKYIPPKYWPFVCAVIMFVGSLIWNGNRFNNSLAQGDVEFAIASATGVFIAVRKGVKMIEEPIPPLYRRFSAGRVATTVPSPDGRATVDLDQDGRIVGVEVIS